MKKLIDSLMGIVVGAVTLTLLYLAVNALYKYVSSTPSVPTEIITPDQEAPVQPTETGAVTPILSVELLSKPYVPPVNPFDDTQYKATAPRMVLSGSFLNVNVYVHGTVKGDGSRFLILNVDGESGIINATRRSEKRLDIEKTTASGGIFTNANAISLSIDLMKTTLGTTGVEYIQRQIGARSFSFIDRFEKVEVKPIVVVPFMENGSYGGAEIDSLKIEYQCQEGKECKIAACPLGQLYTVCIKNEFGIVGMNDWLRRHPQKQ